MCPVLRVSWCSWGSCVHIRSSSVGLIRGVTYVLNEGTLVLEGVTLAQVVKLVVEVLVDLAGGAVADEQTTEDTHAAHPEDLAKQRKTQSATVPRFELRRASLRQAGGRHKMVVVCIPGHTGVLGTLALTETTVTAVAAGLVELTGAGAGVHGDGLADDEAIADELADGLARVGVGDLAHLIGVEPNLALAAADHGGGEALLGGKVDPVVVKDPVSIIAHTSRSCSSTITKISGPRVGCWT